MLSEREEEIFLKRLLKKYHTETSKKEIKRKNNKMDIRYKTTN